MSVTLVTDGDVVGLGFYAEVTVSDSPPDVLDNDLQRKDTILNTAMRSKFLVLNKLQDKCFIFLGLNYVQVDLLWGMSTVFRILKYHI